MKFDEIPNKIYSHATLIHEIDQERVWFHILGYFAVNELILNPLRKDTHLGSCKIIERNGILRIHDWASRQYSGDDCIGVYMRLNPTKSWSEVVTDILKIGKSNQEQDISYMSIPGLPKLKPQLEPIFEPIYRNWDERDKEFWSLRSVSKSQLERNITNVRPVMGYKLTKYSTNTYYFGELCYCYHCNDKFKFYFPNRKDFRFVGNQTRNDLWELNRGSKTLLICKSHKDLLVWENLCDFDLTHVQGEETNHPDESKIFEWDVYYDQILINFDNDNAGLSGMELLSSKFIHTPVFTFWFNEYKDIDEFRCNESVNEITDYLKTYLNGYF